MVRIIKNISKDNKFLYYSNKLNILIIVNSLTKQIEHVFCGIQATYLFPLLSTVDNELVTFANKNIWKLIYNKGDSTINEYLTCLSIVEDNM
jgi:hypothetical protein